MCIYNQQQQQQTEFNSWIAWIFYFYFHSVDQTGKKRNFFFGQIRIICFDRVHTTCIYEQMKINLLLLLWLGPEKKSWTGNFFLLLLFTWILDKTCVFSILSLFLCVCVCVYFGYFSFHSKIQCKWWLSLFCRYSFYSRCYGQYLWLLPTTDWPTKKKKK